MTITMTPLLDVATPDLTRALGRELRRLARQHETEAATEAARAPYWAPCPDSVVGHRAVAALLREDAALLATALSSER